ncbi:MAG: hypothetical protein UW80_C0059G0006 [Microgenomates group bacterium GW2011_GWC1_44_9]|nr:MAG: hypothetical protein UW80_C0059G0006 [Microgenomates group bacterium GW2011_GWC1_44_9]
MPNHLIYRFGECLDCHAPVVTGSLFCPDHNPLPKDPTSIKLAIRTKKLYEIDDGDSGYVEPYCVFRYNSKLFIITSTEVFKNGNDDIYKHTHVIKRKGLVLVYKNSIKADDIWQGSEDIFDNYPTLPAELI